MSTHTADRAPLLRLGPTRAIARRSGAVRSAMAIAVAAFGCGQVLAVENGAAGTIVGAGLVALAVGVVISVVSLIDRYVGWVPVGIAVGTVSLVCLLGFATLGLLDRHRQGR